MFKVCSKFLGFSFQLLLFLCPVTVLAAERLEVEIRSQILNVRETMSTKSPVVNILNQGQRVIGTTTDHRDWIRLDDGTGFISIHYVNVLSRTPVFESPAVTEAVTELQAETQEATETLLPVAESSELDKPVQECIQTPSLEITGMRKTCRKNLQNMAYEACELAFDLSVSHSCPTDEPLAYECSARVFSSDTTGQDFMDELQVGGQISETAVARLVWYPASTEAHIKNVTIREDSCTLRL